MKHLLVLLLASTAFAQQAFVASSTAATGTTPNTAAYQSVTDLSIETRITGLVACPNAGRMMNVNGSLNGRATQNFFIGLDCTTAGVKGINVVNSTGLALNAAALAGVTDVTLRVQKFTAAGLYALEAWSANGTVLYSNTATMTYAPATFDMSNYSQNIVSGAAGAYGNIAWIRIYKSTTPMGGAMPKDTLAPVADFGAWEFEGNVNGTLFNLTPTTGRTYTATAIHPPVLQIAASGTPNTADDLTLDASQSFDYVGTGFSGLSWQHTSGTGNPIIRSPRSTTTIVTGVTGSEQCFALTGTDSTGQRSTATRCITLRNPDTNGQPVSPVAPHTLTSTVSISFNLAGATDVQVTMLKPDGGLLPTVTCTASPCAVPVDAHQRVQHLYKLAYRNVGGAVIRRSSQWAVAPVAQVPPPVLYDDLATNYGWFGSYLPQNGSLKMTEPNGLSSGQYLAYRHRLLYGGSGGGSRSQRLFLPGSLHNFAYKDPTANYPDQVDTDYVTMDAKGFTRELLFWHWDLNNSYKDNPAGAAPNGRGWFKEDKFDLFDSTLANGIIVQDVGTGAYTDKTSSLYAYNGEYRKTPDTSTVVTGTPWQPSGPFRIYLGFTEPWDEANFTLGNAPSGCVITREYWNGSAWVTAPTQSDTTSGLTTSGRIIFTVPSTFSMTSVNGGKLKYFRRINGSSCSVWPIFNSITAASLSIGVRNASVQFEPVSTSKLQDRSQELDPNYSPVPQTFSASNRIYMGDKGGFAGTTPTMNQVTFDLNNTPVGCLAPVWEYQAASTWASITPSADTTSGLTTDGTVSFTLPVDMGSVVLHNNPAQFYYRVTVAGCSTWPIFRSIQAKASGTPVLSVGAPIYKGWCATDADSSRVNVGTPIEYDPTPPANCAAKFKWQGRSLGRWLPNAMQLALASIGPGGEHVASIVLAERILPVLGTGSLDYYYSGVYLDSMFPPTSFVSMAYPLDDDTVPLTLAHVETGAMTNSQFNTMLIDFAHEARTYLRLTYPTAMIATNTVNHQMFAEMDAVLVEDGGSLIVGLREAQGTVTVNPVTGVQSVTNTGPGGNSFIFHDEWRPYVNANCVGKGLLQHQDSTSTFVDSSIGSALIAPSTPPYFTADRGNRFPMAYLSSYYNKSNECTGMLYTRYNASGYYGSSEYYYVNEAPDATLAATTHDYTFGSVTHTINGDFSAFPSGSTNVLLGFTGDMSMNLTKASSISATTSNRIIEDYPAGTEVRVVRTRYMDRITDPVTPFERIVAWGTWFPAMGIRIGLPDVTNGIVGDLDCNGNVATVSLQPACKGSRKTQWMSAATAGTRKYVERRDFTQAIVLFTAAKLYADSGVNPTATQLNTYGNLINFSDGALAFPQATLYPLRADGKTSNAGCNYTATAQGDYRTADGGCTGIRLRTGEGAILMKTPVN